MQTMATNVSTHLPPGSHPAAGAALASNNHDVLAMQMETADSELGRLQGLLDDAMNRLAGAFGTLAEAAEQNRHEEARDVLVSTLQYHDICSQLLAHARSRITSGRALIDGRAGSVAIPESKPHPVQQTDLEPGAVELF